MAVGIIIKNYNHINRSLPGWDTPQGRLVKNKDHYDRLCKEHGMVSYEQAQEISEKARQAKIKPYKISEESKAIIEHAKNSKTADGRVKLSDRAISKLIEKKAIGKVIPEYMKLPSAYSDKGGFSK